LVKASISNSVLAVINKTVSSAKNLGTVYKHEGRSLMYVKNNSGPNMDPWGTPYLFNLFVEL